MTEPWFLLAVIGGIGSSIYNFLTRVALRDGGDPILFAWIFEIIRCAIFSVVLVFEPRHSFSLSTFSILFIVGIIEVASIYVWTKMHSLSHLSLSAIIIRFRLIWIPILAFFILHEALGAREYIGILILLVGIVLAGMPHKLIADKGMRYAYLFSFVGSLLAVAMKAASSVASPALIMVALSLPSVLVLPLLLKQRSPRNFIAACKGGLLINMGVALVNTISFYIYAIALALGPVSTVQSVYQSMMIFSVLAGIILLKEREDILRKLIGTTVTLFGIIVITQ